jgi:methanogenic corrinoid protein MtbC1
MVDYSKKFEEAILDLDRVTARQLLDDACQNMPPIDVAQNVVASSLERIGEAWSEGRIALSQIYMGGRICEQLIDNLLPPASPIRIDQPKMAIATLQDYHMLGKIIVYSQLRSSGYELVDFGRMDIQPLVERVVKDEIETLLISTLMYNSALNVKEVTLQLKTVSPHTKVIVGGAPFVMDRELWRTVGAYAMGVNAGSATKIVAQLAGEEA